MIENEPVIYSEQIGVECRMHVLKTVIDLMIHHNTGCIPNDPES